MELSPLPVMLLLIVLITMPHAKGTQKAVLSIQPDKQVYKGENVTLKCDIHEGGDTEWRYNWMKDNQIYKNSTTPEIHINSVNNSSTGNYTCRGDKNDSQPLEFSDAVTLNVSEKPEPILSVSSKNWLTEGDSVTVSCKVKDSFSDWTYSWHKVVPCKVNDSHIKHKLLLLSDSNRGSGGSYTLSHVVINHTGFYRCRGERGNPAFSTKNSNFKALWITGEPPPVSLIISPNRSQHFSNHSLSLSCEDHSHSSKRWTVRRYMQKMKLANCSQWELSLGSTFNISFLSTSDTGVYWCESETGENINPVNITVHEGDVILESPVHPVTEGHPLTLRCLIRNTNSSNLRSVFYKSGSVVQNQTTGELIIHKVSKSDEGFYRCEHPERGNSTKSWVSVLHEKSSPGSRTGTEVMVIGLSLVFLFIIFFIVMILLWCCKIKKGNVNIYATVDQGDTSGTGETAESIDVTYAQVMKTKKNDVDAESSCGEVTYAEIQLISKKKSVRKKEKASGDADTLYSELKVNMKCPNISGNGVDDSEGISYSPCSETCIQVCE
ncbi:sialoadhesin-like isoform X2 [Silurus meridionalis]|uniref:Ig-like domain-containing protein n=1 Tax=Silurus meridionalis TaxID=175797 RepID=A0A8T0BI96_SILME|nr:sialoadhesin-like isoform X2 [Silurus meridionalis]KAF7706754.1 hypothetical protein HF521_020008 [Silurus meridionalis]